MEVYTINHYSQALERIEKVGHLFDVGQINPIVLSQLYMAQGEGNIKIVKDSWPIRGYNTGEMRLVFEFTEQYIENRYKDMVLKEDE